MKKQSIGIRVLGAMASVLAALCAAAAVCAVIFCRNASPVLLKPSEDALRQAERLMDAVCSGRFSEAEQLLYGTPDLGMGDPPEDPVGAMIWQAYVESLDYVLVGDLYPSDTGVVQDVKFISLELDSVTGNLGARAGALLQAAIDGAEDVSELYDEENAYRKELVDQVLKEAARQALEEDVRYTYRIIPLQLVCEEDRWWGVADRAFLDALSGGIAG